MLSTPPWEDGSGASDLDHGWAPHELAASGIFVSMVTLQKREIEEGVFVTYRRVFVSMVTCRVGEQRSDSSA